MTAFSSNISADGNMTIKAHVLQPLQVEADADMDFGTVIRGENPQTTGKFNILGDPGAKVKATFNDQSFITHSNNKDQMIIQFWSSDSDYISLDSTGNASFNITGQLSVAPNQQAGAYTGTIVTRVTYIN